MWVLYINYGQVNVYYVEPLYWLKIINEFEHSRLNPKRLHEVKWLMIRFCNDGVVIGTESELLEFSEANKCFLKICKNGFMP